MFLFFAIPSILGWQSTYKVVIKYKGEHESELALPYSGNLTVYNGSGTSTASLEGKTPGEYSVEGKMVSCYVTSTGDYPYWDTTHPSLDVSIYRNGKLVQRAITTKQSDTVYLSAN